MGPAARERVQAAASARDWRGALRFCALFLLLVALYAAGFSTTPVERFLHRPMTWLAAACAAPWLSLFGDAAREGTRLSLDGFAAPLVEACNGVLPIYLYLAALVAFPSTWRAKLRGALVGVPALFALNLVRVVSLMVLGARWPALLERVHIDVWQTAMVVAAMGLFLRWVERRAGGPAAASGR